MDKSNIHNLLLQLKEDCKIDYSEAFPWLPVKDYNSIMPYKIVSIQK